MPWQLVVGSWKLSDNPPMPEPETSGRLYASVIVCEVVVVAALWVLGRYFS